VSGGRCELGITVLLPISGQWTMLSVHTETERKYNTDNERMNADANVQNEARSSTRVRQSYSSN